MKSNESTIINLLKSKPYGIKYSEVYLYIVQIGVGGVGSEVTRQLSQMLATSKVPHTYLLADPDQIDMKNLRNQIFLQEEVGLKKAKVLGERYSAVYDINMYSYTTKYVEDVQELASLFSTDYLDREGYTNDLQFVPLLIGAVDNLYTRQLMNELFAIMDNIVYIDAGNESIIVPSDWRERPMQLWTDEELSDYKNSGWTGQVVCGAKLNGQYQPPLAEVYPDVLEETSTIIRPSEVSCVDLAASDPQRTIVNKFSALSVCTFLSEILEEYTVSNHVTQFHAKKGYMRTRDYMPQEHLEV